jgi:GNAT superfamily N-acetyltransferase
MTSEDKAQVFDFLKNRFGEVSVQCKRNRFEWQFEKYPGGAKIYLCFHDQKLVGQSCFLPVTLQWRGERFSAAFSMDTMVSPDYQRKGIGEKFYQLKRDHYQIGLSSGQTRSAANLYKKMGWSVLGNYFEFRLVKRFPRFQGAKPFGKDLLSFLRCKFTIKKHNRKPRIVISSDLPEETLSELDRGLENEVFIKVGPEYLRWRYTEHPFHHYQYIQVFNERKRLGTCVVRVLKPGYYRLVDFYCLRQNLSELLQGISHSLDCYCIEGEMAGNSVKRYLIETGFSVSETNQHILGQSRHEGLTEKLMKSDWLVFGGDSDNDP